MNLIENQVLSPRLNGVSLHVSQSRSGTRAHNINTVKCKLCNNMVSSSSFNSHLVKCHNASPELIKKMSVKTGPVNPPSPPRQPYTTVNLVAGQTVYQSGAKMKFHAYIPEKENSHGITSLVLKSQNGNSPKSNNSSSKVSWQLYLNYTNQIIICIIRGVTLQVIVLNLKNLRQLHHTIFSSTRLLNQLHSIK